PSRDRAALASADRLTRRTCSEAPDSGRRGIDARRTPHAVARGSRLLRRLDFSLRHRRQLQPVTDADRSARDDAGPQAAMQQSAKNRRCLDQTGQVVARLAALLALAFHLADQKAAAAEGPEIYPAHDQRPAGVARR